MAKHSKTGVRGLYIDADGRRRIDLRYIDSAGQKQRYKERLPEGTPAAAATLRARDVLTQALAGTLVPRSEIVAPIITLQQAFEQYLQWVSVNHPKPKAIKNTKSLIATWIKTVGNVAIEKLTPELCEIYKARRSAAKKGPATVNRGIAMVKHMCGLAARSGWSWMTRERAIMISDVAMLKEPPGRVRPIKPKELDALFAAFQRADSRFARRVTAAALLTGCRLGEIITLRDSQVDLKRKTIDLSETKQNRNHELIINAPMAKLLKEAMADRAPKHGGFVFLSSRKAPYTVDGFSKHFAHIADRAGVPSITFHDLRRHIGTTLINAGERLEVVSKLLGHSNVAVTQRSYAHLSTEATRGAFESLAKIAPILPPAVQSASRNRKKTG